MRLTAITLQKVTEPRAQLDEGVWTQVTAPSSGVPPSDGANRGPKRPMSITPPVLRPLHIASFAVKCVVCPSASSLMRTESLDFREQGYSFRLSGMGALPWADSAHPSRRY
jgi:hypothetical protein